MPLGVPRGARLLTALKSMPNPVRILSFSLARHQRLSHLRLSSMIYCSKWPFEVRGCAFLWLAYETRLSRLSICGETIGALLSISKNSCMEVRRGPTPTRRCAWDFAPERLKTEALRVPKPKEKCSMMLTFRTTTRMTKIESLGWRLFTDGGF